MKTKDIGIRLSIGFGIFFACLALLGFSFPFIAIASGTYEGGEQSIFGFFLFALFGAPSTALLLLSAYLRRWQKSRVAYSALCVMVGIPLLVLLLGVLWAFVDSVRHGKSV